MSDVDAGAAARDVRRAWWSLVLFPPALVLAFVVGEGLAALFGHPTGDGEDVPVWVMVAAGGPALLVLVAPALLTVFFARRARQQGDRGGRVPMWIAVGAAGAFLLLNLVSAAATVLLD